MAEEHDIIFQDAKKKISRLGDVILELEGIASSQTGREKESTNLIIEMLRKIESRCQNVLDGGAAFRDSMYSASKAIRDEIGNPGELGRLVGEMGEEVVQNAMNEDGVMAVLEKSIPISGSVLQTASDFADIVEKNATEAANEMIRAIDETQQIIYDTTQNNSNALVGQTANLSTSLTQTTESTIDGILGSVTDVADEMKKDILNPPDGDGVDKMVQNTIEQTTGMASDAKEKSDEMSSDVRPNAEKLLNDAPIAKQRIIESTVDTLGGWIGSGPANTLADYMLYDVQPTYVGDYGGMFNDYAYLAASDINGGGNAIGSAINLVNNMAQGLATLGDSIFGQSSQMSADMAQSGINTAAQLSLTSGTVAGTLSGCIPPIQQSMLKTSASVGQNLLSGVGNIASALANGDSSKISAGAGEVFSGLQKFAGQENVTKGIAAAVLNQTTGLSGGMLDMASSLTSGLVKSAVDKISDMFNKSDENGQNANNTAQNNANNIQNAVNQVKSEWSLTNWAKDWMNKAAEGVKGAVDAQSILKKFGNKVSDLIKGLKNNAKKSQSEDNNNKKNDDNSSSTTTPMNQADSVEMMSTKNKKSPTFGWEGFEAKMTSGLEMMMHDGDQQLLNPFGEVNGRWTMYSFRPCDRDAGYPQIAITPSSFQTLDSMDTMLNNIPYVVVKEYFFKNTASTMMNFVQNILKNAKGASDSISTETEKESNGAGGAKEIGKELMKKLKDAFENINLYQAAVEIPYIFYIGMRKRQFGNTYIFPYIATNSTIINSASNDQEWNGQGGFLAKIKEWVNDIGKFAAGLALNLAGSNGQAVKAFNAPTWNLQDGEKVSFSFDLMLINDHIIKTRNNYMCVNTLIHNNRSIQKAVLAFPGALYEIWLPTGQRHLMCTGKFVLSPIGLNRKVPDRFFEDLGPGANFRMGVNKGDIELKNPHSQSEVIPDGYKLQVTFTSCLANNMNSSVFQYYVKMTGYDAYAKDQPGQEGKDDIYEKAQKALKGESNGNENASAPTATTKTVQTKPRNESDADVKDIDINNFRSVFSKAVSNVLAEDSELPNDEKEKFEESTYNKKIQRLKSSQGDKAINADSVIDTIKSAQHAVRESNKFLTKLYNAPNNNLWYRPYEKEELYTTMLPDYRQTLRKQYQDKFNEIREIDKKISQKAKEIEDIQDELSTKSNLKDRNPILERKVAVSNSIQQLQSKKDLLSDDIIQIDSDLIRSALDEHDDAVSVRKSNLTLKVFNQVWNEKIMNSYEKDKLQYLTSTEKERYFQQKIRDLRKCDTYGVLDHPDWFFRVVVMDCVVQEIQRLIYWFKNCSYDDFDTIYKIVRKLNLLLLDVESTRSKDAFDINRTNLFYISDEDAGKFTKIDEMLDGSTLYEIFQSQVRLNFVNEEVDNGDVNNDDGQQIDKELVQEQRSEVQIHNLRKVRDDVVVRVWGNESNLTKAAYDLVNNETDSEFPLETSEGEVITFSSIRELKNQIIELKLNTNRRENEDELLRNLLGAFANKISTLKEALVMKKIGEMRYSASDKVEVMDNDINSTTIS